MQLPFDVFALFLSIALFIGTIGIVMGLRKIDGAPFITIFAGILIFGQVVATETLIMGYSDGSVNTNPYDVESSTGQVLLNSVTAQARGERLSNTASELEGQTIDCITVFLGRSGSPPATTLITVGVMDTSTQFIEVFGTMNVTSLISSSNQPYQFCLPTGQTYTFVDTETAGIKWNSGDASNTITMRTDSNNPFDGANTEAVQSTTGTSWTAVTGSDMMMIMTLRGVDPTPITFQFNSYDNWAFMIMLSALFIFVGVIFQVRAS